MNAVSNRCDGTGIDEVWMTMAADRKKTSNQCEVFKQFWLFYNYVIVHSTLLKIDNILHHQRIHLNRRSSKYSMAQPWSKWFWWWSIELFYNKITFLFLGDYVQEVKINVANKTKTKEKDYLFGKCNKKMMSNLRNNVFVHSIFRYTLCCWYR